MRFLLVTLLAVLTNANAECFNVGDFKGYSSRGTDDFKIQKDRITSKNFQLYINGESSKVSGNNLNCMQAGTYTLLCFHQSSQGQSTIETWSVYPSTDKAVYTKSINGYGQYDGGNLSKTG